MEDEEQGRRILPRAKTAVYHGQSSLSRAHRERTVWGLGFSHCTEIGSAPPAKANLKSLLGKSILATGPQDSQEVKSARVANCRTWRALDEPWHVRISRDGKLCS